MGAGCDAADSRFLSECANVTKDPVTKESGTARRRDGRESPRCSDSGSRVADDAVHRRLQP